MRALPRGTKHHLSWSHQLHPQQLAWWLAYGPKLPRRLFLYEIVLEHGKPTHSFRHGPCLLPPSTAGLKRFNRDHMALSYLRRFTLTPGQKGVSALHLR